MSRPSCASWTLFRATFVLASLACFGAELNLSALASATAISCPNHDGIRTATSSSWDFPRKGLTAVIHQTASRVGQTCRSSATLTIARSSGNPLSYALPIDHVYDYSVVDYSPDGSMLAVEVQRGGGRSRDIILLFGTQTRRKISFDHEAIRKKTDMVACDNGLRTQAFASNDFLLIEAWPINADLAKNQHCPKETRHYLLGLSGDLQPTPLNQESIVTKGRNGTPELRPCKSDPDVVAECFVVHGRYSFWNGNPSFRIWHVGTHRILGVVDDESPIVAPDLWKATSVDKVVWGDFGVCPFTKRRPDEMQRVCVESATHLFVQDFSAH